VLIFYTSRGGAGKRPADAPPSSEGAAR